MLILGGIYGGVFTPTEAAGVAVFYALFIGLVIYRELTLTKIIESLRFTALIAGLLILLTPTLAFGQLTAFYDVPSEMKTLITSITENQILVMMLIGLFYIFVGTFMESLAQIIFFTAVFLPVASTPCCATAPAPLRTRVKSCSARPENPPEDLRLTPRGDSIALLRAP